MIELLILAASTVDNVADPVVTLAGLGGLLTGMAGIITAVAVAFSHKKTSKAIEANVGKANGHGSLMAQMLVMMESNVETQKQIATVNERINEHLEWANDRLGELYRELGDLESTVMSVQNMVEEHVSWELTQKYPTKENIQ